MKERTLRVYIDKVNNRFAIRDSNTDTLLHIFEVGRKFDELTPDQIRNLETDAINDFLRLGTQDDDEDEPGW